MWKPSTVEDIRDWMNGSYVPNPSPQEFEALFWQRIRAARADGTIPTICLVPLAHPSRR